MYKMNIYHRWKYFDDFVQYSSGGSHVQTKWRDRKVKLMMEIIVPTTLVVIIIGRLLGTCFWWLD